MKSTSEFEPSQYQWAPQPEVAAFVREKVEQACASSAWLAKFQARLIAETGTRLVDWLDHIAVATDAGLEEAGFAPGDGENVYANQAGIFPKFTVAKHLTSGEPRLGLKVERIEDFIDAHASEITSQNVFGPTHAQVRIAELEFTDGGRVCVVERHGDQGMIPGSHEEVVDVTQRDKVLESFRQRKRSYDKPDESLKEAALLVNRGASAIGKHYACDLFFQAEREFWQSRNTAAQVQFQRQQKLGLGWANHDHHTYRCSRVWFKPLILTLELMGFQCRERFYAGKDAGWGAQVLEHPGCGIVIFADVDLTEDEVIGDFAHDGLAPRADFGTVGLWCELHGDSILAAGMHHLECQFDFDAAREQLAELDVETMAPFTDFPYLKQAFTKGETWQVDAGRLESLVKANVISSEDAERFQSDGVIGSHLEILERNDGFKGFNQTGISKIIRETNPTSAE